MTDKTPDQPKKKFWDHLHKTNVKIGIVIAFFVGYQELRPIVKDVLGVDDDIQAVVSECNLYTDEAIDKKQNKAEMYLDILVDDVYKINQRYIKDSIEYDNNHRKFAVGFRSDLNGIMSYRDRFGNECSTRINHDTKAIEFYNLKKEKWDRCFFEDL